ncbi:DMT family transporter [Sporosarcina sp. PTS2304]|uniref:DMT family transporter n=1 Tax=Sporosarcina sp. PTS2304 TaxID=2283194 RepID=UPI000E0D7B42|nr:DMT family transporter [Sporosarcina sp. PTS2304]AXH99769.1 DMT family transporter [Sporosarcina sp. PTS2304]
MKNKQVYVVLIGIMFMWGINVSAIKVLVNQFDVITITALRIFAASLFVFFLLACMKLVRLPRKEEWLLLLGGMLTNVVFHHYFLADGLSKTSAANGGLILGLGPLLTAVLAVTILKEQLTVLRLIGFLLGGAGVSFTVLAGSGKLGAASIGDIEVFLSILSQALSFLIIKKASQTMDARLMTGYMLLMGSVVLMVVAVIKEPTGFQTLSEGPWSIWLVFAFSALLATAVGHMLYNSSIKKIGAASASIFLNFNTFFALIGAGLFLGEKILLAHFVGFVLIVMGVSLGSGAIETYWRGRKVKQSGLR